MNNSNPSVHYVNTRKEKLLLFSSLSLHICMHTHIFLFKKFSLGNLVQCSWLKILFLTTGHIWFIIFYTFFNLECFLPRNIASFYET